MKKILENLLNKIGIKIIKSKSYCRLVESEKIRSDLEFSKIMYAKNPYKLYELIEKSKSQIRQDIAAVAVSEFKENGYFVEFGATNGITLSNTYLLEKMFKWKGILAEPARRWHHELELSRNCDIEKKCIWSKSDEKLNFVEVDCGELSTIKDFSNNDIHSKSRKKKIEYVVDSISMNDLLEKYKAPNIIDYFSIDTEGSEYEILEKINYEKYKFKFITLEHNYTSNREKIYNLLTSKGYERICTDFSKWDDWYINFERNDNLIPKV